jgi:hypothetical protein
MDSARKRGFRQLSVGLQPRTFAKRAGRIDSLMFLEELELKIRVAKV